MSFWLDCAPLAQCISMAHGSLDKVSVCSCHAIGHERGMAGFGDTLGRDT